MKAEGNKPMSPPSWMQPSLGRALANLSVPFYVCVCVRACVRVCGVGDPVIFQLYWSQLQLSQLVC